MRPTLVAVDQIDGVVNPSSLTLQGNDDLGGMHGLGEVLAAGLLQFHDVRHRGKTIITCLFDSWKVLEEHGLIPFRQRFADPIPMQGMNNVAAVRALIVDRLAPAYKAAKFTPPFPSWPFTDAAITSAASVGMMPRTILMRCDAFRRASVEKGSVEICDSLVLEKSEPVQLGAASTTFDSDYARLRTAADISGLIMPSNDAQFGHLLQDVFDLYARQIESTETIEVFSAKEKSDLPEVAKKQSNKAASAAAETVERRGGAKENAGQQNTVRTQSREAVSRAQVRIREAVTRNRQDQLTALLHHVNIDVLRASFFELKKTAAPGVDERTWTEYAEHLEANLLGLHARVHTGAYRALPSRRKYIPKADGRQRRSASLP
jgi:hypothetical protein